AFSTAAARSKLSERPSSPPSSSARLAAAKSALYRSPTVLPFRHRRTPMTTHAAIVARWFEEVWNQGNEATIDEFFSPQGHSYGFPNPDSVIGRDEFKATVRQLRATFTR